MSSHIEQYENEDPQQVQQVARLTEQEVQARIDMICDRLRYESFTLREYVTLTSNDPEPPTWMPTSTADDIGKEIARWTWQACDDRDGMIVAYGEAQR